MTAGENCSFFEFERAHGSDRSPSCFAWGHPRATSARRKPTVAYCGVPGRRRHAATRTLARHKSKSWCCNLPPLCRDNPCADQPFPSARAAEVYLAFRHCPSFRDPFSFESLATVCTSCAHALAADLSITMPAADLQRVVPRYEWLVMVQRTSAARRSSDAMPMASTRRRAYIGIASAASAQTAGCRTRRMQPTNDCLRAPRHGYCMRIRAASET